LAERWSADWSDAEPAAARQVLTLMKGKQL
jgi:hypothetical protein